MHKQTFKEYLLRNYPPNVRSLDEAYACNIWKDCTLEEAIDMSNKIIELFKEVNMTYNDAYAMLGFIRMDLDYRSERVKF